MLFFYKYTFKQYFFYYALFMIINFRVEKKVEELESLHRKHLSRPNFDDESGEERTIQKLTQETTQV